MLYKIKILLDPDAASSCMIHLQSNKRAAKGEKQMKLSIGEAAKLSGVTVRTLHYYDRMGLLAPSEVSESGYRYYNEAAMERLQRILFYRELDFSLEQIAQLLQTEDRTEALRGQKHLLMLQRDRLNRLITLLDDCLKGENKMDFTPFDQSELEQTKAQYAAEAKQRWGKTEAYVQSETKAAARSKQENDALIGQMNAFFARVALQRKELPESDAAQKLVEEWCAFLTANYYDCTPEILNGLGIMYTEDERFLKNIDRCGDGTAAFFSRAIAAYCRKQES